MTVHEMFESRVRLAPDALAVRDARERVTYRELAARAGRLAARLQQLEIAPEGLVAVMTEPSVDTIVASLAAVKAGAAYVALDPAWPAAIRRATLQDAGARVLVTSRATHDAVGDCAGEMVVIDDSDTPRFRAPSTIPSGGATTPERLFAVVYTSGTSGRPKGVLIPERAVLNRLSWMWSAHPYRPGDVSLLYRSHAAIGFTWDCFGPLLQGVPILVAAPPSVRDAGDLVAVCVAGGVSHVSASAGRWEAIVDYVEQHAVDWSTLRLARCSGEPLPARLVGRWRRAFPRAALLNVYGASECSSATAFDTASFGGADRVPVGTPVPNVAIYVVDDALRQVSPGRVGEICIGGACVAGGYLGQPGLTADRFLPDPFCGRPGQRMFRSGDVGVYRPDAGLEVIGRRDRQVKIRGFRVELDEVEAALAACAGVRAAAVAAEEHAAGDARLVAYVVIADEREWSPAHLRSLVAERVPDHMVPAAFVRLRQMPLTASGKVARALLASRAIPAERRTTAPTTPAEEAIAAIWRSVLEMDDIDVDDDFFEIGGDSLKGMRILSRMYAAFSVEIPLGGLLDSPTIRTLAATVDSAHDGGTREETPSTDDTIAHVRQIVASLAPEAVDLADDASLFETGAIDSITYLSILREIEERYALPLSGGEVVLTDLSTIRQIAAHISARRPVSEPASEPIHLQRA